MSKHDRSNARIVRGLQRPLLESLEVRALLASNPLFFSAYALDAVGAGSAIQSNGVTVDAAGDTFVTGFFRGSAGFNPGSSATLTTAGTQDGFVAEYSPTGALDWVKTFAGTLASSAVSQGSALAVDPSGDVFVSGSFTGSVSFGGSSLSSNGQTEAFVTKLGPTGTVAWVTAVTGSAGSVDSASAIALDSTGLPVIGGSFQGTANFGGPSVNAGGQTDAFLAKLDLAGGFLWSKVSQGATGSVATIHGLAVDALGDAVGVGQITGSVNFDPGATNATVSSSLLATSDAVVWKVGPTGGFGFINNYGGLLGATSANSVAVDPSGNIYTTGGFTGPTNLNLGSLVGGLLNTSGINGFVMKLSPTGVQNWADGLAGSGVATGKGIAVDPSGVVDVAGPFSGSIDFDPVGALLNTLTSVASTDIFNAGFDPAGNLLYHLQSGTSGINGINGLAVDPSGVVSMVGNYAGPISFGSTTLPAAGVATSYLSKLFTSNAAPSAPSAPVLTPGSQTGTSSTITAATAPIFNVATAASMDTVELLRNGSVVATRTGPGTIQDPGIVPDGTYTYTSIQVSPLNVASSPSAGTSLTIDTMPPALPTGLGLLPTDDTGLPGYTSVTLPHLTGTSIQGDTVELFDGLTMIGQAVAGSGGAFSIVPTAPLTQGVHTLTAKALDQAGNLSAAGLPYVLTLIITPPAAPTGLGLLPTDDTGLPGYTSVTLPHLTGTSIQGDTVELFDGLTMIGQAVAGSGGAFSIVPTAPLTQGVHTLTAKALDQAGNLSAAGLPYVLTLIITPPAAPTGLGLLPTDDTGLPGYTNVTLPHLIGTSIQGDTVELFSGSTIIGQAVAGSGGAFSIVPNSALVSGSYFLTAKAVDLAGNASASSSSYTLNVITTPPSAPGTPSLLAADVTGAPGSNITNLKNPEFVGSGVANTSVEIVDASNNNTVIGTAAVASNGSFMVPATTALANGVHMLKAIAMDAAGNLSSPSASITITVDAVTLAPLPAPSLLPADNSHIVGGGTSVTRPRLVGTALPGARVDWLSPSGSVLASATASSTDGSYTLQAPYALPNGTYPVVVRETDIAGNVSPNSSAFSMVIRVPNGDYNGDGKTDLSYFDPKTQTFSVKENLSAVVTKQWGVPGDVPVQGNFFGDGETDFAVFRPSTSTFYVVNPTTGVVLSKQWGTSGDMPVTGDFFGDGRTDFAVFRPSTSTFFAFDQATGAILVKQWGGSGDLPVVGDYFGDGRTDFAVYRPSTQTFYVNDPTNDATMTKQWGAAGDLPVVGDYFGDGRTDFAVFRPSTSTFYVNNPASGAYLANQWGGPGDLPIPGDYDGDGKTDYAVYRPSTSTFYVVNSASNTYYGNQFGTAKAEEAVMIPAAISLDFLFGNGDGGIGAPAASSAHGSGMTADYYDMALESPESPTIAPPATADQAHDRAIHSLSLERWRPGA